MMRTPLAWCNLTHDRIRFGLFVLGIAFAVILIFVQLGFRNALLDSNTQLIDRMKCDLVIVAPNRQAVAFRETFPRRRLDQARAVPGVTEVHPLYLENGMSLMRDTNPHPEDRKPARGIRVIGVDPSAHLLDLPELAPGSPVLPLLNERGAALFDRRSKKDPDRPGQSLYGPLAPGATGEMLGQRLDFVGDFELGTDFTADGSILVSEETFRRILRRPLVSPGDSSEVAVDIGLVRVERGRDVKTVRDEVRRACRTGEPGQDVEIFTIDELKEREKTFWLNNTPIGFAFGFGMFMGFAVGLVICYQILSGDVTDHLPEYATLKAFGYSNGYLAWVVIQESLILAIAGFLLGWLVSWGAYELLGFTTGLPLKMTPDRIGSVLLTTIAMCCISGLVALVGLVRADPADVF